MVALIVGIILLGLGIWGLAAWIREFWWVLKGSVPFIFILCGLAAIAVGLSSVKDKAAIAAKEEPQPEPEAPSDTEDKKPEEKA